jgi:hypothetical protein
LQKIRYYLEILLVIIYLSYRVYEQSSTDSSDDDLPRAKQSKFGPQFWSGVKVESVETMPNDINGRKVYEIESSGSAKLSAVRDGRKWKKDSGTQWCGFSKVRYSNCAGSYECTNPDCDFKREYGVVNRTQFDKNHLCRVCRHKGRDVPCMARRYVAFLPKSIRVYHHGNHTCPAKPVAQKPVCEIKRQLTENPGLTPSVIQSNLIVSQMREGKVALCSLHVQQNSN